MARLRARFAGVYALVEGAADDHGLPTVRHATAAAPAGAVADIPAIDPGLVAAYVLTSGSTGEPVPHAKPWGLLIRNARAEASRLAAALGRADLAGVTLVATVPPQHMYGFESSVLIALHGGAVLDAERPFFPADIAAALARAPAPRVLVTTPFHLKTLLDADIALPPLDARRLRDRAAVAAARRAPSSASARRCSRSTAAPKPARWRRAARPRAPSGRPSTAFASTATAPPSPSAAATCRSRRCSPTCSRSSTPTPSACSAARTT